MFDRAVQIIFNAEGGYSDDQNDPGGKTKYGITEAVAHANGYHGSMYDLPMETAKGIYRREYWDACRCDDLPWPLTLFVFDAAVNQGVGAATKMLQAALNTGQDGIIGKQTLALAAKSNRWHAARYLALRAARYQGTRNYDHYGHGWLTRTYTIAMEA